MQCLGVRRYSQLIGFCVWETVYIMNRGQTNILNVTGGKISLIKGNLHHFVHQIRSMWNILMSYKYCIKSFILLIRGIKENNRFIVSKSIFLRSFFCLFVLPLLAGSADPEHPSLSVVHAALTLMPGGSLPHHKPPSSSC